MSKWPWDQLRDNSLPASPMGSFDSDAPAVFFARGGCSCSSTEAEHPCILACFDQFLSLASGKRVVVFLDYDGTLTPIVSNPNLAVISESMRGTVKRVAQTFPTAIITGRGRRKVEGFIQLDELFYAGSHGLDIKGPVVQALNGEEHEALPLTLEGGLLAMMAEVTQEAERAVRGIPGATVEDNTYCVSIHFRNCSMQDWPKVLAEVEAIVGRRDAVHMTRGRKVLEIRPRVDWDKGKALMHLLRALGLDDASDILPVYIGDDRTDEDAFRVLRGFGVGVLVTTRAKPTDAEFVLNDPDEVGRFLERLVDWGCSSSSNAWHADPTCVGWAANPPARGPATTDTDCRDDTSAPVATRGMHHVSSLSSVSTQAFMHMHHPAVSQHAAVADTCHTSAHMHAAHAQAQHAQQAAELEPCSRGGGGAVQCTPPWQQAAASPCSSFREQQHDHQPQQLQQQQQLGAQQHQEQQQQSPQSHAGAPSDFMHVGLGKSVGSRGSRGAQLQPHTYLPLHESITGDYTLAHTPPDDEPENCSSGFSPAPDSVERSPGSSVMTQSPLLSPHNSAFSAVGFAAAATRVGDDRDRSMMAMATFDSRAAAAKGGAGAYSLLSVGGPYATGSATPMSSSDVNSIASGADASSQGLASFSLSNCSHGACAQNAQQLQCAARGSRELRNSAEFVT